MDPKAERTFLYFLTTFLVVMLAVNVVRMIMDPGTASPLLIACYAGGLVCTVIAWIQHFRGNKEED